MNSSARAPRWGRLIKWPAVTAAAAALFFVMSVSAVRESYRGYRADQEIRGLEQQIAAMEGKRTQLSEVIRRLQSSDALEKEARARLGMRKEGERVYVLQGEEWKDGADDGAQTDRASARSNPQKWFAYFFLHTD